MIVRPPGLELRCSLRSVLGDDNRAAVEKASTRQERTIDAILHRLYNDDEMLRREFVLLADEVGLGKTFVALGVAWSVLHQRSVAGLATGPVLVVTPHAHALFRKWIREAEQFLQLAVPSDMRFEVKPASTPHELACALRRRKPTLVIARMSAFSGRLHQLEPARMATIHSLLHMDGLHLSMGERLEMLSGWDDATRENLDLRRSSVAWRAARSTEELKFDHAHTCAAWRRLEIVDSQLCRRIRESWNRVRTGRLRRAAFWKEIRELSRASIGQTVPHCLPLVIVDEIHNWKNHPTSWSRFLHTLGLRMDRLLGLSATPFQLGPHELIQVLDLRRCLRLSPDRASFLDECVSVLGGNLQTAGMVGESLRQAWTEVGECDLQHLERAWSTGGEDLRSDGLPPRLQHVLMELKKVRDAHAHLGKSLKPFLLRHRRDTLHRAWWVGRESDPQRTVPTTRGSALRWSPGLDVEGDAELVHYLMMRAVQEDKAGHGSTSLGADLGGSYSFFREGELKRRLPGRTEVSTRYLDLVKRAISGDTHEHPKVKVTADRAFRAWWKGEKTLVFCFNIKTVEAVHAAVNDRIQRHNAKVLTAALGCAEEELDLRLKNLQKRLYNYRQSVFLLFQDHPLSGARGSVPRRLALRKRDIAEIAARLATGGPPRDRSRFDRRRVLAAAEQVLVARWKQSKSGWAWLEREVKPELVDSISAADWPVRRRDIVEGVLLYAEPEALPDDENIDIDAGEPQPEAVHSWRLVIEGRAGRATLAPYLADHDIAVPSLLTRCHSAELAQLPSNLRALAARMLRRMVRSPGFLARFILNDPSARPDGDGDIADEGWASLIHRRYETPPAEGESARVRFDAYLKTLQKAVGLKEQIAVYEEASKNRDVVTRVIGSVPSSERDRLFTGFNTPLVPEILIVTTVGQEGIDLHRECRHVIHHDLPWNPATLEQRTGRVDRIGSKTERLRVGGNRESFLDVAVPYIAGTYDEHRFRVLHGRAHIFEVTMGGDYAVDGYRVRADAMETESPADDLGVDGEAWASIPESIAAELRLDFEAESPDELGY